MRSEGSMSEPIRLTAVTDVAAAVEHVAANGPVAAVGYCDGGGRTIELLDANGVRP
jgi:dienelactone hydrolase